MATKREQERYTVRDLQWYLCPKRQEGNAIEVAYASDTANVYRRTTDKRPESCSVKVERAAWYPGIHGEFEPWNGSVPNIPASDWKKVGENSLLRFSPRGDKKRGFIR